MRGADAITESLFSLRRLEDFVPDKHPLRPVRKMVNSKNSNSICHRVVKASFN
jgi:hypothetical protein